MKRSVGILLYRKHNDNYEVLLAHFGGPYWVNKDIGGWSLQKGLMEKGEKAIDTAKREVIEETNLNISNDITYFTSKKVSNNKLIIMFKSYFDGDLSSFKSNTFTLEWPKNSGKVEEFPEMNEIKWFSIEDAKKYINPSQTYFINRFEQDILRGNIC